jgi:hypothetical protein
MPHTMRYTGMKVVRISDEHCDIRGDERRAGW